MRQPRSKSRQQGRRRWSDLLGPQRARVSGEPAMPSKARRQPRNDQQPGNDEAGEPPAPDCASGSCECQNVDVASWVMPMASEAERACVLLAPRCPNPDSDADEQLFARMGMHPGLVGQNVPAMVHLVTDHSATLAYDTDTIGPFTVPPRWTDLARRDEWVFLLVGTKPATQSVMAVLDENQRWQLGRCLVPVSNEKTDGR